MDDLSEVIEKVYEIVEKETGETFESKEGKKLIRAEKNDAYGRTGVLKEFKVPIKLLKGDYGNFQIYIGEQDIQDTTITIGGNKKEVPFIVYIPNKDNKELSDRVKEGLRGIEGIDKLLKPKFVTIPDCYVEKMNLWYGK